MNIKIGILLLNFNGRRHLEAFMAKATFLRDRSDAELIVIDNASGDTSAEFLHEQYPWVEFVRNDSNYGWGEGYNRGIDALLKAGRRFTHYLFLNNDTEPSLEWFEKLLAAAMSAGPDIGEIGCRAVFKDKHIVDNLLHLSSHLASSVGVYTILPAAFDSIGFDYHGDVAHLKLSSSLVSGVPGQAFLGMSDSASVRGWYSIQLYNKGNQPISVQLAKGLRVDVEKVNDRLSRWVIRRGDSGSAAVQLGPDQKVLLLRVIEAKEYESLPPTIQNSGIGLTGTFEGHDLHLGESWDQPQNYRDLKGICGVCKLVRAEVFHEVGGFDPVYFMYYEDLDFSLRLTKLGYKRLLVPDALLIHAHAGTSDASSMFFSRQVCWSLYYFHWRHAGLWRRFRSWISWRVRAASERQMEPNNLARPSQLAVDKFAKVVDRPYLMPSVERR